MYQAELDYCSHLKVTKKRKCCEYNPKCSQTCQYFFVQLVALGTHQYYLLNRWVGNAAKVCYGWIKQGILKGEVSLYH